MPSHLRHPMVLTLVGLIVILVPGLVFLAQAYAEARDRYFDPSLPAVPTDRQIAKIVESLSSAESQLRVAGSVYEPSPPPRSGVVRADLVRDEEDAASLLAVLRHDVSCSTCNNLQVAVLIGLANGKKIQSVRPLEPWELSGQPLDPTPFLNQFTGHVPGEKLVVGENVDGITGATLTVDAFLYELQVLGEWVSAESLNSSG